ncbi:MAG: hypothetical protein Q7S42_05290 [Candidatus Omnitrophota bacterium]|nr:hypothetical protein [Candidatus Omnitrophota bacterium]
MKKWIALSVLAVLVFSGRAFAEEKTIKGEVIDVSCYVAEGAKGDAHKECAIVCIKAGQPAGILEEGTGKVYVAAKEEDHMKNSGTELLPYVAKMVEVKGSVSERGGVATIDVKEIKEIENATSMMEKKGSGMMEEKKGSGN